MIGDVEQKMGHLSRRSDGNESVVWWERSGASMQSNRCSYVVRAFVRRYWGKVCRVFEESL